MKTEAPIYREPIEWCDVRINSADSADLPRVLFVGDSITQSYYEHVRSQLAGTFACARITTSRCVCDSNFFKEMGLVLSEYEFAVVHFNNGLHGESYDNETYTAGLAQAFDDLLARPNAGRLIWASSTPFRETDKPEELGPKNERVRERNRMAASLAAERDLPVNDLFAEVISNLDYIGPDGVHLTEAGQLACAKRAVDVITEVAGEKQ